MEKHIAERIRVAGVKKAKEAYAPHEMSKHHRSMIRIMAANGLEFSHWSPQHTIVWAPVDVTEYWDEADHEAFRGEIGETKEEYYGLL